MRAWFLVVVASCGQDSVPPNDAINPFVDGPPPPGLSVRVVAPDGGESFYQGQPVTVRWVPHDDIPGDITCEVVATGASSAAVASGAVTMSDQVAETSWTPDTVGDHRIAVTCTDAMARTATDESNASFTVTPPPQVISFAGELQPILTASCVDAPCHDNTAPQAGLKLINGVARAELVGIAATQCGTIQLVAPGAPNDSYLIDKLVGSNPGGCFIGTRMPKQDTSLTAAEIQAFRDWIANGAPDN